MDLGFSEFSELAGEPASQPHKKSIFPKHVLFQKRHVFVI